MQIGVGRERLLEDRVHTSEGGAVTNVDACTRSRASATGDHEREAAASVITL
jgi:hypothetical protein